MYGLECAEFGAQDHISRRGRDGVALLSDSQDIEPYDTLELTTMCTNLIVERWNPEAERTAYISFENVKVGDHRTSNFR
jgi:hypothetical protein